MPVLRRRFRSRLFRNRPTFATRSAGTTGRPGMAASCSPMSRRRAATRRSPPASRPPTSPSTPPISPTSPSSWFRTATISNRNDADDFTGASRSSSLRTDPGRSPTSIRTAMSKPTTARRIFSGRRGQRALHRDLQERRPCRLRILGRRIEPDRRNADGRYRRRTHRPAGVGGSRRHPPGQRQLYQAR